MKHQPIDVEWTGGSEFEAHRAHGPKIRIDGDARTAPSPFDVLLASIATCSAIDVVSILRKQRTPVAALRILIEAQRVDATPRRLASAVLHFAITAPGTTAAKAARAVELSVTRYCSVRSSLLAEVPVTWTIELEPGKLTPGPAPPGTWPQAFDLCNVEDASIPRGGKQ